MQRLKQDKFEFIHKLLHCKLWQNTMPNRKLLLVERERVSIFLMYCENPVWGESFIQKYYIACKQKKPVVY
jgi:hypothetical protein